MIWDVGAAGLEREIEQDQSNKHDIDVNTRKNLILFYRSTKQRNY